MIALLQVYRVQIKTQLAIHFQYRVEMAIWMIGLILDPIIYLVVWSTVAQSSGGSVGGFTSGDFAAYYLVFMIVTHATQIWHMYEFDYLIRQGVLSARLLRPIHPIHEHVAENLSYKLLMLVIVIPTVILLALAFHPTMNPPLWAMAAFIPALILAGFLSFFSGWTLALAAFWTTRTAAINELYFVVFFFFSGQMAPIGLLPDALQKVANFLPFRWFMSFPVELLLGRLTSEETLTGFVAQAIWLILSLALLKLTWRAGLRRYSAVGN